MNWAVGVTTAPRPRATLQRTLASLEAAGWPEARVFDDLGKTGVLRNWLRGLRRLLDRPADADVCLMVQDDAIFCRGLRSYLDDTLWPAEDVALCSPYCPGPYRRGHRGWHRQRGGWYLVGAVCWAIPRPAAEAILADLGEPEERNRLDAQLGRWAKQTGRSVWYHTPSLVQHVGLGNSAIGDRLTGPLRSAADFVGEEHQL